MPELLIGTYFKRPKAPVDLPNGDGTFTSYFFRPVDPANPDSEHVALVSNTKHQQRLLAIDEGYYISEAQLVVDVAKAAAASTPRPTATPSPVPPVAPEPPAPATAPASAPADSDSSRPPEGSNPPNGSAAADELLALPLAAFKKAVTEAPQSVLRQALEVESARGVEERPTYTKALRAAIKD